MHSAPYEYRKMSAGRGWARFVSIFADGLPEDFPAETTKLLSTRIASILMMSSLEYLFIESE